MFREIFLPESVRLLTVWTVGGLGLGLGLVTWTRWDFFTLGTETQRVENYSSHLVQTSRDPSSILIGQSIIV